MTESGLQSLTRSTPIQHPSQQLVLIHSSSSLNLPLDQLRAAKSERTAFSEEPTRSPVVARRRFSESPFGFGSLLKA